MIDSRYKQYLNELELARVEILGGKTYEGTILIIMLHRLQIDLMKPLQTMMKKFNTSYSS